MESEILALGIEGEHEDGTLWFDLNDSAMIANYFRDNIERGEKKTVVLKVFLKSEFEALD